MGVIAAVDLVAVVLASMLGGLVLGQLMRMKKRRRSSEAIPPRMKKSRRSSEAIPSVKKRRRSSQAIPSVNKRRRSSEAIPSVEDLPPGYEYDVFLSFRGPDTRNNFTDCLYCRLQGAGVNVFLDNEELRVGVEIGGELLKALNNSRIYIPIFSQDSATSSWCLREVERMVEHTSKSDGKKEILPIFYDVDPKDVKLRTERYTSALPQHEKMFGSDTLKRWEDALGKVAHIKGWEAKGKRHGELIELVVGEVLCKLNARKVDVPQYLVEDHPQIKDILEKLELDYDGVRFLGIHGTGGIGKTVLAKVVFNRISSRFDGVCFLDNVRELSRQGLVKVQKKLLSRFVGRVNTEHIEDIGDGMNWIKKVCRTKKVLIVLDDLNKEEQLKKLAGKSDWFGSGSRIIFTTRNLAILRTQVESSSEKVLNQPKEILAYEVHKMEFGQALRLFCKHAFRRDSPIEGYDHLAKKIVHRVGMLPLAIEEIGSSLFLKGVALGPHGNKRKLWEQTLNKLDRGPFEDVRDALMISYERLGNEEKEVFLDITCLFPSEDQTYPVFMWDKCNYYPDVAIAVLLEQSLIKIGDDNKFWMHDQVRDLGRHIILEEYPRKFSRVWIYEIAVKLLERKEINEDVKALSLTSDGCIRNIVPEELAALPCLRFLRVKGVDFVGNFEYLVLQLCWLSWEVPHNRFYANNLHFANLVVLNLSRSNIEDDWGGWSQIQMTKNLKVLDLTDCTKLTRTPNFSNFMSLEILVLAGCSNLIQVDPSISKLKQLEKFKLEGCGFLRKLPFKVRYLQSLTEIVISKTSKPKLRGRFGNGGSFGKLTHLYFRPHVGMLKEMTGLWELRTLLGFDESKARNRHATQFRTLLKGRCANFHPSPRPLVFFGVIMYN